MSNGRRSDAISRLNLEEQHYQRAVKALLVMIQQDNPNWWPRWPRETCWKERHTWCLNYLRKRFAKDLAAAKASLETVECRPKTN